MLFSTFNTRPLALNNYSETNLVYRSDKLDKISDIDIATLLNKKVTDIIDLRRYKSERKLVLLDDSRFLYHFVPLEITSWEAVSPNDVMKIYDNLPTEYMDYVAQYEKIYQILSIILCARGKTIIMCSQGKDRTGVIIAIILLLLNVENKVIIEDYIYSTESFKLHNKECFLEAKAEIMQSFLDEFMEKYHSILIYLRIIGFEETEIKCLKDKLLHISEWKESERFEGVR